MAGKMRENEASTSTSGSSSTSHGETAVVDWGRHRSSCGYCRSTGRTSVSHGLWAHSVTVDDYQDLLDRGWRRSGSFLYKPEMEKTCCPSYTIRLKASDFVPSKEQLRVCRRMQRYLDGTLDAKQSMKVSEDASIHVGACNCSYEKVSSSENKKPVSGVNQERNEAGDVSNFLSDQIDNVVCTYAGSWKFPCNFQLPKASVKKVSQSKRKLLVEGAEDLIYTSNIAFQMAAIARRAQSSMKDAGKSAEDYDLCPKTIAEKLAAYLNELSTTNLLIRACNGHINFYAAAAHGYHGESNQMVVSSNESASGCKKKDCLLRNSSKHPQGKRKRLEIHLKRSSFDPEEFSLYRRYQLVVHNDTPDHVTESSYRTFLVDTPLVFVPPSNDGRVPPCGFGSFHQQYVIDGKLVAVGVVDILPNCLSSKYLFWDPDFAFLSLGKYSALQEIGWVKENQVHCASLQYYYLGYYIHSCNKMRYKAAYRPSELLCPRHYQWVQFDTVRPLLDRKPYVVLSDHVILQNEESLQPLVSESDVKVHDNDNCYEDLNDAPMVEDEEMIELEYESSDDGSSPETDDQSSDEIENGAVHDILIGLKGSRMRYKDLLRSFGPDERSYLESQLRRYQRAVGGKLAERIVYSLG